MAEEGVETTVASDADVKSKIMSAVRSRISYFISQSDSLKFEGARRFLEKDLGMPEFSLDPHKSFVKEVIVDCLNQSAEAIPTEEEKVDTTKSNDPIVEGEKMDESPVMGLLQREPTQTPMDESSPCEEVVKKALWDRSSYIQSNSENVTMAGLRRLLEEDLNLEKFSLDPFKKLISNELDEILNVTKEPPNTTKKSLNGGPASNKTKNHSSESKQSRKRKNKGKEANTRKKSNTRSDSNDNQSNSSAENLKTRKEVSSTQTYGKRVELLKSVIKSCSLNVPPAIYRKVKQLSESQRETKLVKELEAILSKEGLSSNPSEKEIKEVKQRKQRAKDLEGIDTRNIVSSSRRRASYVPVKKIDTSETESDEEENEDEKSEQGSQNNEKDENGSEESNKNEEIRDVSKDDDNQTSEETEDVKEDENDDETASESEYELSE